MARDLLNAWIRLEMIRCYDEGDGWGDAEPYLWTVFFTIDGSGVVVTDALTLSGAPAVHATPGSHGNLGTTDVNEGENVPIPSAIGEWKTLLRPIEVPEFVKESGVDDLPGVLGVVCVLMEQDDVTDAGAEAGHHALNSAVLAVLEKVIATRTFAKTEIEPAEVEAFMEEISGEIPAAIKAEQSFFQNFWSFLNADDLIGSKVFFWEQDEIAGKTIRFSQRWKNEGDWEILGHVSSTVACPANAVAASSNALDSIFQATAPKMREFRDSEFHGTGLPAWWALAERNAPELAYCLGQDDSAAEAAAHLLRELPGLLDRRDEQLADEFLDRAQELLRAVKESGGSGARRDAALALEAVAQLRGKTAEEALAFLGSTAPAKRSGKERRPPATD